jgi:hypothetical protein
MHMGVSQFELYPSALLHRHHLNHAHAGYRPVRSHNPYTSQEDPVPRSVSQPYIQATSVRLEQATPGAKSLDNHRYQWRLTERGLAQPRPKGATGCPARWSRRS